MKTFCVTVPTIGWFIYEVQAEDAEDAQERVRQNQGIVIEENSGDWADGCEWDVEEKD